MLDLILQIISSFISGTVSGIAGIVPFFHINLGLEVIQKVIVVQDLQSLIFLTAFAFSHLAFQVLPSTLFFLPVGGFNPQTLANGSREKIVEKILHVMKMAAIFSILLLPIAIFLIPIANRYVSRLVGWIILAVIGVAVLSEKDNYKKLLSLIVLAFSGMLGLYILPKDPAASKEMLFPILTGLFGLTAIFEKLGGNRNEEEKPIHFTLFEIGLGVLIAMLSSMVPAMTPTFLAAIALLIVKRDRFVALAFSIIFSKFFFEMIGAYSIHKGRSAFAAQVLQFQPNLMEIAFLALAAISSFFIACEILKFFSNEILLPLLNFFDSKNGLLLTCISIFAFTFYLLGVQGIAALSLSFAVGMLPILFKTNRSFCMGFLLIPTLTYFFHF